MKIGQRKWDSAHGWQPAFNNVVSNSTDLILIFGGAARIQEKALLQQIKAAYPKTLLFGCSTTGEIIDTLVSDDTLIITAITFEHTQIKNVNLHLNKVKDSFQAGEKLAQLLPKSIPAKGQGKSEKLIHVLVLSDGLKVNGSDLVRGLTSQLPDDVTITGGLAGDGERFVETNVFVDNEPQKEAIAAIGLYGSRLKVGYSSLGGWDSFGPERIITRSSGNVLYELDGHSALELYKKYLGDHAKDLPSSGLLFPLSVRNKQDEKAVVRTILGVDEKEQSMTFAGDVPEGSLARFMKANFDRLIDGAVGAAKTSLTAIGSKTPELAILISCGGRKLILKQRVEEEVEGVRDVFGDKTIMTGFYSYGEISPFTPGAKCELHNQSMTITTLLEE
jgi:hypothetical protein